MKRKEKSFWFIGEGLKIAHHEYYGKTDKKMNTTSENMTYIIDNKKDLCKQNKLHPLTYSRGKWIPDTLE